ncbi:MAG: hypothetical protein AAB474_02370 [Patescibacteria group bacterium]
MYKVNGQIRELTADDEYGWDITLKVYPSRVCCMADCGREISQYNNGKTGNPEVNFLIKKVSAKVVVCNSCAQVIKEFFRNHSEKRTLYWLKKRIIIQPKI